VTSCRIYLGGVLHTHYHATATETALRGQTIGATIAAAVGKAAVSAATPMTGNSYKKQWAGMAVQRASTTQTNRAGKRLEHPSRLF
jgi:CO/xanthine dehydrogenase FAD-binding subunit